MCVYCKQIDVILTPNYVTCSIIALLYEEDLGGE